MSATCPSEAKDQAECEAQCKELPAPMGTPYSLKLAASGTSQLACRLHALTEARDSGGKADVLKNKCEVASGKRPCT